MRNKNGIQRRAKRIKEKEQHNAGGTFQAIGSPKANNRKLGGRD